ncbi:MAG: lysylphosphatidylglycerol synthase transmembrane domain-containing protein [Paracoccaceae bacterium]
MTQTNPATPLPRTAKRRLRDRVVIAGLLGLFIVGLIGLATATGWAETWAQVAKLGPAQIAALLALSLANYLLRALRWHLFARRLGLPTALGTNALHFLAGFAMTVTPGRVGELVRMRWLRRETGWSFERTAPLVLVDRASDLAAMAVLLGLTASMSATGIAGAVPVTALALIAAVIVTRPALLAGLATRTHRATGLWPRLFARVRRAARSLARFADPRTFAVAAVLGGIGWFAEGFAFHLLLVWMGADIGLAKAVAIFIFSALAGGLTGAPGGVGGAEAAMIALLALDGVPLDVSVAATAIIRLTTLWFAILIGMILFPLAERRSLKGKDALENL